MPPRSDQFVNQSNSPIARPTTTHACICDIFANLTDAKEHQCFHSPADIENSQRGGNGTDNADTTEQNTAADEPSRSTADIEGDLEVDNYCKVDISNTLSSRTRSAS